MKREVITHMYRNSGESRLIDKVTGYMRILGFYKVTDTMDIIRDADNAKIGRFEVAEGFGPIVKLLSNLSNFKNTGNQTTVWVREDNGKIVEGP